MNKRIKTGGRQKGSLNKTTIEVKQKLEDIWNSFDLEDLRSDIKKLEPKERLNVLLTISEYLAPKLQRQTIEIEAEEKQAGTIQIVLTDAVKEEMRQIGKILEDEY